MLRSRVSPGLVIITMKQSPACAEDPGNLNDGSGRELHCLHNTALQHLRALKVMGSNPSGAFIASMLELKLDTYLSDNATVNPLPKSLIS